jgi:hypothetical protein
MFLLKNWIKSVGLGIVCVVAISCSKQKPDEKKSSFFPIVPEQGLYLGAYVDFGEGEAEVTLEAIEKFQEMVGKPQAIIASGSFWGDQAFPKKNCAIIDAYGAVPLLYWSPWDKPYMEDRGVDRFSLKAILEGKWDAYIDLWSEGARQYGKPLYVAWGLEMNGTWFPWSGYFYGGGKILGPQKWEGPENFKKTYRYVVDRVRKNGVKNIQWVFHSMNYPYPDEEWNQMAAYYPGSDYVDWLALSVYGKQFKGDVWKSFRDLAEYPYNKICQLDPQKPVMLAEWGVGEYPESGRKGEFIANAFEMMKKFPRLKAAVFWHERWENSDGTFSNLRVNSSPEALEAFQKGAADSYYWGRPQFKK